MNLVERNGRFYLEIPDHKVVATDDPEEGILLETREWIEERLGPQKNISFMAGRWTYLRYADKDLIMFIFRNDGVDDINHVFLTEFILRWA